jgi:hypothetical protein
MKSFSQQLTRLTLFIIVAISLNWVVYSPAFHRVFADDQIYYLAELHGSTSLTDGLHFWDYAITRYYAKGDETLFRPLLFVWLAAANSLFGYHYVYWNIANFAIHLTVVFLLYAVLSRIQPGIFAALFALLFSVSTAHVELVMWNHLGGYLLAFACLLMAILAAEKHFTKENQRSDHNLAIYAAAMTISCLFYETMVPISVFIGTYILCHAWKINRKLDFRLVASAALPVVIFIVLYIIHYFHSIRFTYVYRANGDSKSIFFLQNLIETPVNSINVITRWTAQLLFPSNLTFLFGYTHRFVENFTLNMTIPLMIVNVLVVVSAFFYLAKGFSFELLAQRPPFALFSILSIFAYALIICVGRPMPMIDSIGYYLYFFALLFFLGAYSLIDFKRLDRRPRQMASVSLGVLIIINAYLTLSLSNEVYQLDKEGDLYFQRITSFVDAHRDEPGFTFAVKKPPPTIDLFEHLAIGYPDQLNRSTRDLTLSQIFYYKYYDSNNPKYVKDFSK